MAPDVYTYSSLVTAYARLGDVENAVKTLSDMSKSGVKPNRFTLSSVMQVIYEELVGGSICVFLLFYPSKYLFIFVVARRSSIVRRGMTGQQAAHKGGYWDITYDVC